MGPIRSPLAALGALMVLLQGIAAAALVPLDSQPTLQGLLVYMMVSATGIITILVVTLVGCFAWKNPGLLFSPRDIDPAIHRYLYPPQGSIRGQVISTSDPET